MRQSAKSRLATDGEDDSVSSDELPEAVVEGQVIAGTDDLPVETEQEDQPEAELPVEPEPAQPPAVDSGPFPLAEPGAYYEGLWNGLPNFRCPYCIYATLEGPSAVELHILFKIEQGNKHHLPALELK